MSYAPDYDPYYGRSMSRRPSMSYAGSAYSHPSAHPVYHGGMTMSEPTYPTYAGPGTSVVPMSRRVPNPSNYEQPYYHDRPVPIAHTGSIAPVGMSRRHSTVNYAVRPPPLDSYRVPSAAHIKFRRKGAFSAGIGLDEAQSRSLRLSGHDSYTHYDLHTDHRGCIYLKIKWVGYSSLTYEIPLDGYDGRIDLETLARRVSRACVHYLQANVIPVPWDRVQLHHLEEVSYGVWQPMLSSY